MPKYSKDNAEYFNHDANARHNHKIKHLEIKMELAGYAIYWKFLEFLASQDHFRIDITKDYLHTTLPADFGCTPEQFQQFLSIAKEVGLIIDDDGVLYSPGLIKRLEDLVKTRERKRMYMTRKRKQDKIDAIEENNSESGAHKTSTIDSKAKQGEAEISNDKKSKTNSKTFNLVDNFTFREILKADPFRFKKEKIEKLINEYGQEAVIFQLESLLWKMNHPESHKIEEPVRYFIASLKGQYDRPKDMHLTIQKKRSRKMIDEEILKRQDQSKELSAMKNEERKLRNQIREKFNGLSHDDKHRVMQKILKQMSQDSGLSSALFKVENIEIFEKSGYDLQILKAPVRAYILENLQTHLTL